MAMTSLATRQKKKEKKIIKGVVAIICLQKKNGGELLPSKEPEKGFWTKVKFLGCDLWF